MGFPTTLSMNLVSKHFLSVIYIHVTFDVQGMLVGWGVLSPIAKFSGWAPGPVGSMTDGARGYILWISLGERTPYLALERECAKSAHGYVAVIWDSSFLFAQPSNSF